MSDNIFDRLMELLQSPGPVNWRLAEEAATSIAGGGDPIDAATHEEYVELTRVAQLHVARTSSLEIEPAATRVRPVTRSEWARSNLQSFKYLVEPLADKMGDATPAGPMETMLAPLGPALLGIQMGTMVGYLSHKVLGQFDVGLPSGDTSAVYFVVPNVESFARDHGVEPSQARLWVALHEVTHQAEFSVPWVMPHFRGLINRYFEDMEFDPSSIAERLEGIQSPEDFERIFRDSGGLPGLMAGPRQQEILADIQAFMAVMEGYGDFLMDRAAPGLIPDAPRLREAIVRRRAEESQGETILQQMLGLELKRQQYVLGAEFCADVERRWGPDALAKLWDSEMSLPTLSELEDPVGWAARTLLES